MAKTEDKNKKILLTAAGLQKSQDELETLKTKGRLDVAARLKTAIEFGDLSENAEYDEAKNQQAFIEARIAELESQLKNVEVVEESKTGAIQIGSDVVLKMKGEKESHTYTIVGSTEADSLVHKISNESPLGSVVLGKKKGEKVTVVAPGGEFEYEVIEVK
jgi:transcription elongation factor GreA